MVWLCVEPLAALASPISKPIFPYYYCFLAISSQTHQSIIPHFQNKPPNKETSPKAVLVQLSATSTVHYHRMILFNNFTSPFSAPKEIQEIPTLMEAIRFPQRKSEDISSFWGTLYQCWDPSPQVIQSTCCYSETRKVSYFPSLQTARLVLKPNPHCQ